MTWLLCSYTPKNFLLSLTQHQQQQLSGSALSGAPQLKELHLRLDRDRDRDESEEPCSNAQNPGHDV